jgi:hypothetical protein
LNHARTELAMPQVNSVNFFVLYFLKIFLYFQMEGGSRSEHRITGGHRDSSFESVRNFDIVDSNQQVLKFLNNFKTILFMFLITVNGCIFSIGHLG